MGGSAATHTFFEGHYHFTGSADVEVDKACTINFELRVNGLATGYRSPHTAAAKKETLAITRLIQLSMGDVVTVWVESDVDATTLTASTLGVVFCRT